MQRDGLAVPHRWWQVVRLRSRFADKINEPVFETKTPLLLMVCPKLLYGMLCGRRAITKQPLVPGAEPMAVEIYVLRRRTDYVRRLISTGPPFCTLNIRPGRFYLQIKHTDRRSDRPIHSLFRHGNYSDSRLFTATS
ncbi:hypothetical protein CBL_01994 [Carabus blaptoides fortunei]